MTTLIKWAHQCMSSLHNIFKVFFFSQHGPNLTFAVNLHLNCKNKETISLFPWARARCSGVCWDTIVVSSSMRNSAGSPPEGSITFNVWAFGFPPLSNNTFTSSASPFSQAKCNPVSPWKRRWTTVKLF